MESLALLSYYGLSILILLAYFYSELWLQRWHTRQWCKRAENLCLVFDELELQLLPWPVPKEHRSIYKQVLQEARVCLEEGRKWPATRQLTAQRWRLKQRLLAAYYRLEEASVKEQASLDQLTALQSLAQAWWEEHPVHAGAPLVDKRALKEIRQYPEFIDLLLDSPLLRQAFLTWIWQDHNPVVPFIEYPCLQEKIVNSQLAGRLQYAEKSLIIDYPQDRHTLSRTKTLGLLCEGRYVPLNLMDYTFTWHSGITLSIRQLLALFSAKHYDSGRLEVMYNGVTNWHALHLARWEDTSQSYQSISMETAEWWRQLPFLKILDRRAVRRRYGIALNGKQWVAAATATRGTPTLDYENSHAYLEIAIPLYDGRYAIYPFGKFASRFPKNFVETMEIFCHSVHASIAYPDENVYYSHRQTDQHAFALTANQGHQLMDLIRADIMRGRSNNLVYQIESENCAKWVQTLLQRVLPEGSVPNLFIMPLLDAEPQGVMATVFKLIKKLPSTSLQTRIFTILHYPLGAWRGNWIVEGERQIWKAMNDHPFWYSGLVYLPAFLHQQRRKGILTLACGAITGILLRPKRSCLFGHEPYSEPAVKIHAENEKESPSFFQQLASKWLFLLASTPSLKLSERSLE